jgi:hypothetical protein
MFTTGSKLFFGATVLSFAGALLFGITTGGPAGLMGTVGLVSVGVVFAFLAGINFFNRDGNVSAMEPGIERTAPAAQPPVNRCMWPLVAAVGVGGLVVGSVSRPVVFKVAVVVLLAAIVEWMVQAWAERASSDAAFNDSIRKRILHPLEFPILATVVVGGVLYGFSRIMLTINKDAGRWVFIGLGAIVVAAGFVIAGKRGMSKTTIAGVTTVGAVALLGVGVVSALQGQRTIEAHPVINAAVCLGSAPETEVEEIDHNANQSVGAKSNVISNVILTADDRLVAFNIGITNVEYHEITVPRSTTVHVLFENRSSTPRRLTAHLGTFKATDGTEGSEQATCTAMLDKGGRTFLTIRFDKSQLASSTPYFLSVPELEGQEIKLLVP